MFLRENEVYVMGGSMNSNPYGTATSAARVAPSSIMLMSYNELVMNGETIMADNYPKMVTCDMCQGTTPYGKPCEYCGRPTTR